MVPELNHVAPMFRMFHQLPISIKRKPHPLSCFPGPVCLHALTAASSLKASTIISFAPDASPTLTEAALACTRQSPTERTSQFCSFVLAFSSLLTFTVCSLSSFRSLLKCHFFSDQQSLHRGDQAFKYIQKGHSTQRFFFFLFFFWLKGW